MSLLRINLMLLLISMALSLDSGKVICDSRGQYFCPEHFNCCKLEKKEGYSCCYETKACASDGEHCYLFDIAQLRFRKTPALMTDSQMEMEQSLPLIKDLADFAYGFLSRIGFFSSIPKTCSCVDSVTDAMLPVLADLLERIINIKTIEDLLPIVHDIQKRIVPMLKELLKSHCKGVPEEVEQMIEAVAALLKKRDFYEKVIANIQKNYRQIVNKLIEGKRLIEELHYLQAGERFGDAFNLIFT